MRENTSQLAAQVVFNSSGLDGALWVMEQFKAAGFQVGPLVGISFSIAAPVQRFEEVFKVKAQRKGQLPFAATELPVSSLNPDLRRYIEAVLFTQPPDFGPGSY